MLRCTKLDGIELVKRNHEKDTNIRLNLMSAFDRIDNISGLDLESVQRPIHIGKLEVNHLQKTKLKIKSNINES